MWLASVNMVRCHVIGGCGQRLTCFSQYGQMSWKVGVVSNVIFSGCVSNVLVWVWSKVRHTSVNMVRCRDWWVWSVMWHASVATLPFQVCSWVTPQRMLWVRQLARTGGRDAPPKDTNALILTAVRLLLVSIFQWSIRGIYPHAHVPSCNLLWLKFVLMVFKLM